VQADCPIPPQIQQWLYNERREAAALRQNEARSSQRPSTNTPTTTGADKKPAAKTMKSDDVSDTKRPAKKAKNNDKGEKLDDQENPPQVDEETEPNDAPPRPTPPTNLAAENWLALNNATPQLNGEILVEGPIQIPTFVQQHAQDWADYSLSLATPFEEPPPDATDEERREAAETWALFHLLYKADGTIYILHPNRAIQEAPQWIQDWMTTHTRRELPSPTSSTISPAAAYLPPPFDRFLTPIMPADRWLASHSTTITPTG